MRDSALGVTSPLVALSDEFRGRGLVQIASIDAAPGDFHVLALQIRDAGLLDRRPGYYSSGNSTQVDRESSYRGGI
jgi:hypothetical protein